MYEINTMKIYKDKIEIIIMNWQVYKFTSFELNSISNSVCCYKFFDIADWDKKTLWSHSIFFTKVEVAGYILKCKLIPKLSSDQWTMPHFYFYFTQKLKIGITRMEKWRTPEKS